MVGFCTKMIGMQELVQEEVEKQGGLIIEIVPIWYGISNVNSWVFAKLDSVI